MFMINEFTKKNYKSIFSIQLFIFYYLFIRLSFLIIPITYHFKTLISIASKIIPIWGIILILYHYIYKENYKNIKECKYIIIFFILSIISILLNFYDFKTLYKQASELVNLIIILFLFFCQPIKNKYENNYMNIVFSFIIVVTFITTICSLYYFFKNEIVVLDSSWTWGAIYGYNFNENRLWGIYTDPNIGAVIAVISLFLSFYFILKKENCFYKIVLIINIIIQFLFIVLTMSRTAKYGLYISICMYLFMYIFKCKSFNKKTTKFIVCLFSISLFYFTSIEIIYQNMPYFQSKNITINELFNKNVILLNPNNIVHNGNDISNVTEIPNVEENSQQPLHRKESKDNGRFSAWRSAFKAFIHKPLFGTTRTAIPNVYKNYNIPYAAIHNGYIEGLVSFGLFGCISYITICYEKTKKIINDLVFKRVSRENLILVSLLLFLLWSAMFYTETILVVSFVCAFFNLLYYYLSTDLLKEE